MARRNKLLKFSELLTFPNVYENYEVTNALLVAGQDDQVETLSVLHTLFWLTSIFGMILLLISAQWISLWVFEDTAYTNAVRGVAIALFFRQMTQGKLTQLQGLRRLGGLAKANLWGNFMALLLTVPLYYFYQFDAIVPAIIIGSLLSFTVTT